jgi:hypothetical protein
MTNNIELRKEMNRVLREVISESAESLSVWEAKCRVSIRSDNPIAGQGNWHSIAKQVIPGYADMPLEIQKYRRMQLRANAHSHLYDARTRRRRTAPIAKQEIVS